MGPGVRFLRCLSPKSRLFISSSVRSVFSIPLTPGAAAPTTACGRCRPLLLLFVCRWPRRHPCRSAPRRSYRGRRRCLCSLRSRAASCISRAIRGVTESGHHLAQSTPLFMFGLQARPPLSPSTPPLPWLQGNLNYKTQYRAGRSRVRLQSFSPSLLL